MGWGGVFREHPILAYRGPFQRSFGIALGSGSGRKTELDAGLSQA